MTLVGFHHRFQDILTPLVHVVLGTDADGLDGLLRTDDMFEGVPEFLRQLAMGDKHQSDHQQSLQFPNSNGRRIPQRSNYVHRWGRHHVNEKAECKPKMADFSF